MRLGLLVMLLSGWLSVCAQTAFLVRGVKALGEYIDSSSVRGIDPRYISIPKRPWQVMTKYNMNQMNLSVTSHIPTYTEGSTLHMKTRISTSMAKNLGLWVGYRGYGIGYSKGVGSQSGTYFTIGATGSSYGFNFRLRTFSTNNLDLHLWGTGFELNDTELRVTGDDRSFDYRESGDLDDAIRVRSLIIDGYYFFNGKRFSFMAAYDQSAVQLRSAGSLMVGAMWHNTTLRYNSNLNAGLVDLMNDIGVLKIYQGSLGVGYAYNWVPAKGFLVNMLAMPMLTLYNRQKLEYYDAYIDDLDDSGKHDFVIYRESESRHSRMTVTFDARLSLTYNWERVFACVYGQWNHFRFSYSKDGHGHVNDWYVNASLGVRF